VTLSDHQAADFEQAAYFRAELDAARRLLLADLAKRRALIDGSVDAGRATSSTPVDAELHHIDWLIERLDRRFALGGDREKEN
jgi:hypothetical protein